MSPTTLFTIGALAVWTLAVYWARRRHTPHEGYTRAITLATLYCLTSEAVAIRLGKYHYEPFALTLPASWFSWLDRPLHWLATKAPSIVTTLQCGGSMDVPLEIALFEAGALFSIYRVSHLLFPHVIEQGRSLSPIRWMVMAAPMALLNGALAVNLDAVLDPVVSGTQACAVGGVGASYKGLLWTWHTTKEFEGHWFGIPLANYTAWFAALFAFSVSVRVGRVVTVGFTRKNLRFRLSAFLRATSFLVFVLFAVKFLLDHVVYYGFGQAGGLTKPATWQFAVLGTLLVFSVGTGLIALTQRRLRSPLEWNVVAPQMFSFAYCLLALTLWRVAARSPWLYPLLVLTLIVATGHAVLAVWRCEQRAAVREPVPRALEPIA